MIRNTRLSYLHLIILLTISIISNNLEAKPSAFQEAEVQEEGIQEVDEQTDSNLNDIKDPTDTIDFDLNIPANNHYLDQSESKIIGGQPAQQGEFPYQVLVTISKGQGFGYCGGSLIHPSWVLTAAHCLYDKSTHQKRDPTTIKVYAGSLIRNQDHLINGERRLISQVIVHSKYQPTFGFPNDIGLLKLSHPINHIKVAQLIVEDQKQSIDLSDVWVSGWGKIALDQAGSKNLLKVKLPIVSNEVCNRSYPRRISSGHICAGFREGGYDSCQGDSGGPLTHRLAKNQYAQIGLVSWGHQCAKPGYPGVYTRISKYIDWIKQYVHPLSIYPESSPSIEKPSPITLKIYPKSELRLNDELYFKVKSRISGQVILIDIKDNYQVEVIFPNNNMKENIIHQGQEIDIPTQTGSQPLKFYAVEPIDRGLIYAIVIQDVVKFNNVDEVYDLDQLKILVSKSISSMQKSQTHYHSEVVKQLTSYLEQQLGKVGENWWFTTTPYSISTH